MSSWWLWAFCQPSFHSYINSGATSITQGSLNAHPCILWHFTFAWNINLHQVSNYSDRVSPFSLHSLLRETTSVKHISETNFFQWNGGAKPLKNHGERKSTGNVSALFLFRKTSLRSITSFAPNESGVFFTESVALLLATAKVSGVVIDPLCKQLKKRWTKKG